jgi:hypothetical protein
LESLALDLVDEIPRGTPGRPAPSMLEETRDAPNKTNNFRKGNTSQNRRQRDCGLTRLAT